MWTIRARDAGRTAADTKHMRTTAGYILTFHKTNIEMKKRAKYNRNFGQNKYERNWLQFVSSTGRNRSTKILKKLHTNRQMKTGETIKKLLDV